jgi:hypothetical protein
MLGFQIRGAEVACFVAGEKDYSTSLFGIAFKHGAPVEGWSGKRSLPIADDFVHVHLV